MCYLKPFVHEITWIVIYIDNIFYAHEACGYKRFLFYSISKLPSYSSLYYLKVFPQCVNQHNYLSHIWGLSFGDFPLGEWGRVTYSERVCWEGNIYIFKNRQIYDISEAEKAAENLNFSIRVEGNKVCDAPLVLREFFQGSQGDYFGKFCINNLSPYHGNGVPGEEAW